MAQRKVMAISRFPFYNNNIMAHATFRMVPLRYLARVRGVWNQVNGVFRISRDVSMGTSPLITIQEAFEDKLRLRTWRAAIAVHVVSPSSSVWSATRDEVAYIISQAHAPLMVIFQFIRRSRKIIEVGFFATATSASKYSSNRRASVLAPRKTTRALPCPQGTGSTFSQGVNLKRHKSKGICIPRGDKPPKLTQSPSGKNTTGVDSYALQFCGMGSQNMFQLKSRNDQAGRFPAKGHKTQTGFRKAIYVNNYPWGMKYLGSDQEPQGNELPGLSPGDICGDSEKSEGLEYSLSNVNSGADINDKRASFLAVIKMAWLRAMTYFWHYVQNVLVPFSILLNNASEGKHCVEKDEEIETMTYFWHYVQNVLVPFSILLNNASEGKHCVEKDEEIETEMKKTFSEKGPITSEDPQSLPDDCFSGEGVEQNLEGVGGVQHVAQSYQLCLSNSLGCTVGIYEEEVKERFIAEAGMKVQVISDALQSLSCSSQEKKDSSQAGFPQDEQRNKEKRNTEMREILNAPQKNCCSSEESADASKASDPQNYQGKGTINACTQDKVDCASAFNVNKWGRIKCGNDNLYGCKPQEVIEIPDLNEISSDRTSRGGSKDKDGLIAEAGVEEQVISNALESSCYSSQERTDSSKASFPQDEQRKKDKRNTEMREILNAPEKNCFSFKESADASKASDPQNYQGKGTINACAQDKVDCASAFNVNKGGRIKCGNFLYGCKPQEVIDIPDLTGISFDRTSRGGSKHREVEDGLIAEPGMEVQVISNALESSCCSSQEGTESSKASFPQDEQRNKEMRNTEMREILNAPEKNCCSFKESADASKASDPQNYQGKGTINACVQDNLDCAPALIVNRGGRIKCGDDNLYGCKPQEVIDIPDLTGISFDRASRGGSKHREVEDGLIAQAGMEVQVISNALESSCCSSQERTESSKASFPQDGQIKKVKRNTKMREILNAPQKNCCSSEESADASKASDPQNYQGKGTINACAQDNLDCASAFNVNKGRRIKCGNDNLYDCKPQEVIDIPDLTGISFDRTSLSGSKEREVEDVLIAKAGMDVHGMSYTLERQCCFSQERTDSSKANDPLNYNRKQVKRNTEMKEILHAPEKDCCSSEESDDDCKLSDPQNDQENGAINACTQDSLDCFSAFNENKEGGMKFENEYSKGNKNQEVDGLADLTGAKCLSGISSKGEDEVKGADPKLSNTYSIAVTDNQISLCETSFKMAWLRIVALMLKYSQELCLQRGRDGFHNEGNKLLLVTEENENDENEEFAKEIHSEQTHFEIYDAVETAIDDELTDIAVNDKEDFESESIVEQLEIEDEDQLDMVLQEHQGAGQNGFVIQNPAPIVNVPPYNPMAHIPPLDQAPNADNILPVWLLAFQAHLANVQAQAPPPPLEPPGPNEEAPLNDHPAQVNHHNPNVDEDDEGENVDDVVDQPGDEGVNGDAPVNEAVVAPPPPPVVPPQAGQHPPQQPHPTGLRNRLRAAARYVKRKITRRNHHHGHPMYYTGPWEERPPLGLEEALPIPPGHVIHQHDEGGQQEERSERLLSRCFGFLYRRQSAPVQEYPLQADQAPAFEEVVLVQAENAEIVAEVAEVQAENVQVQDEVHEEMVEEVVQQEVANEQPQDNQALQQPIAVL